MLAICSDHRFLLPAKIWKTDSKKYFKSRTDALNFPPTDLMVRPFSIVVFITNFIAAWFWWAPNDSLFLAWLSRENWLVSLEHSEMVLHIWNSIILCLSISVIRIQSNSDRGRLTDVLKIFKGCYIRLVEYSNLIPGVETIFEDPITLGFSHKSKHVCSHLRIFEPCGVILIVNPPVSINRSAIFGGLGPKPELSILPLLIET